MHKLSDAEIGALYQQIAEEWEAHLKVLGIRLPALFSKNGGYSKNALVLVKLAEGYPDTKPLSKQDLTAFMKLYYPDVNDVQQARHLGAQQGFYILSGTRGNQGLPKNSYWLKNLREAGPAWIQERRAGYKGDFEQLKQRYEFSCATCGSQEGKPHRYQKNVVVQLQKGHMDNGKALQDGNIIPQCQICNRADRNRWIYDKTGRVTGIAATEDGLRAVFKFLKRAGREMRARILQVLQRK